VFKHGSCGSDGLHAEVHVHVFMSIWFIRDRRIEMQDLGYFMENVAN